MVTVQLTNEDWELCNRACIERMDNSAKAGLNHACLMQRTTEQRIEHEVGGIAGELATARFLGLHDYEPLTAYIKGVPDINPDIEVRSTRWDDGHLCVRTKDQDDRRFVLAVTSNLYSHRMVRLMGWCYGWCAKDSMYLNLNFPKPEYWVPASHLNPMGSLLRVPDEPA